MFVASVVRARPNLLPFRRSSLSSWQLSRQLKFKKLQGRMSGSTNSASGNESLKAECNSKREAEFEGADLIAKKLKTEAASESTDRNDEVENGRLGGDVREEKNGSAVVKLSREVVFEIEADVAEDKGSRHAMEDASVVLLDASMDFPGRLRCAHFAVYDGHGGRLAAEHAQKHLHLNVLSAGLPRELVDVKAAKRAILDGFRKTDESLLQESTAGGWQDGATAVCVWILGQKVFVANVGDAKAVVARSPVGTNLHNHPECEGPLKAIVLTREHKAIYRQERARIEKAGGIVSSNGRIQGRLEVSRAFGDRQFKKVGVIATPDIHSFDLTERDHFMIIGCDGLWGVFGPNDAVDFVWKLLKDNLSVAATSRHLVREAVRERRCKDNCTAIVIIFRHKSD